MPRLILMAPCERAIVEEKTAGLSMIGVISSIKAQGPLPIPDNTVLPREWWVVSTWLIEEADTGRDFEARLTLHLPDGRAGLTMLSRLDTSKRFYRAIVKVSGLPISPAGVATLRAELRELTSDEWRTLMDYPIEIEHVASPAS